MLATELLVDGFGRVAEEVPGLLADLTADDLRWRPRRGSNPIGWLVWHLARVEDDHLAGVASAVSGQPVGQVWTTDGWFERFALPYAPQAHGYGHSDADVDAFRVPHAGMLADYYAATHRRSLEILAGLTEEDFATVVDENWDPPVTAAVRLVSVLGDVTQHLGQAAYVRGMLDRSR